MATYINIPETPSAVKLLKSTAVIRPSNASLSTSIPIKNRPNPASANPNGPRLLAPPLSCSNIPSPISGSANASTLILKPMIATSQPVMVVPILDP